MFNAVTNIISGSNYPTANLFLNEVYRVKVLLDRRANDDDVFIQQMVSRMKSKFDKYWGECNLLMSIASVLDPRCKMRAIEYCFSKMYLETEARENVHKVREAMRRFMKNTFVSINKVMSIAVKLMCLTFMIKTRVLKILIWA